MLLIMAIKAGMDMAIAVWAAHLKDWRLALMFFGFAIADVGAFAIAEAGR